MVSRRELAEPRQNGACGHSCISPVLHQVELLEALLNYHILNTLYPQVNGKNHYGFFQIKDNTLWGGKELDLEMGNRALLQVE